MTILTTFRKTPARLLTRSWPYVRRTVLLTLLAFMCFIFGVMVVILPPLAIFGVVGVALLVLLWVIPDIPLVSERLFRVTFLIAIVVQFTFPAYYAILLPGLPWISARRLTWLPMILLAGGLLASSAKFRSRFSQALSADKLVSALAVGFFVWMGLSILTSASWPESFKDVSDAFLNWYLAAATTIIYIRNRQDTMTLFRVILFAAMIAGFAGMVESLIKRHFYLDILPASLLDSLTEAYPSLIGSISREITRGGQFRANYIYFVSLSYGEYLAMSLPICLYFVAHGQTRINVLLGWAATILSLLGVLASGGRGAAISAAASSLLFGALWVWRYMRQKPNSMAGALALTMVGAVVTAFVTLFATSHSFRVLFTGGGEAAGSTDARFEQWQLAVPKIIANPITGSGTGIGAYVIGYFSPGGQPTVDSSIISLLVEVGVPGFLMFFVLIAYSIWLMLSIYFKDDDEQSAPALSVGCALVSFGIYRLVLTQRENQFFFFMLVAMALTIVKDYRERRSRAVTSERAPPFARPGARPQPFGGAMPGGLRSASGRADASSLPSARQA